MLLLASVGIGCSVYFTADNDSSKRVSPRLDYVRGAAHLTGLQNSL